MVRVLLISPPYVDLYGAFRTAAGLYFPLGLGYLASFLRKHGVEVSLYEPEAQRLSGDTIREIFAKEQPDLVGITSATPNFFNAVKLARIAKAVCRAKVVLGGVHASALPSFIAEHYRDCFDFVVVGEGEYTLLELVRHIDAREVPLGVSGLCFWHEDRVVQTPARPLIQNLDTLPFPARDLIPQELFHPNMHNARYKRCVSMLTSRGCPFSCSFCASYLTMGKKYRTHSAEYVLEEMTLLKEKFGAQQLLITDDTFTIDRDRLVAICEGMIREKLNLKWFCFSQVTAVDEQVLPLMSQAGCYNIGFGVESGSPRVLRLMRKPIPLERCERAISLSNAQGLKTQAFFIFGTPGETTEEMEVTIDFALRLNPTLAFFNMLVPYPGTLDFRRLFKDVPLAEIDWRDFVAIGERSVINQFSGQKVTLEEMMRRAYSRFYLRPRQLLHIVRRINTLYEFTNYAKGGLGLFAQMAAWRRQSPAPRDPG